tara:strand:- start:250 stop:387 length:138 start_codon:yes stop_codon:yes gene_type:complete
MGSDDDDYQDLANDPFINEPHDSPVLDAALELQVIKVLYRVGKWF